MNINDIDTFLIDCDGVIWSGVGLIPGSKEALAYLRSKGKRLLFVTNNSTKSRASYVKKFTALGIQVDVEEIFGSSYAAAYYIKHQLPLPANQKRVYVIGMEGITDELDAVGIEHCGSSRDNTNLPNMDEMGSVADDPTVGAVLCGFDLNINYLKLAKAFTYLSAGRGVHFVATNVDLTFPAGGRVYPGTGAMVASLSEPLGRRPVVVGKPEMVMLDVVVDKFHLDRSRTCMIGDRLDTDILFGQRGGLKTLLVMTGVTTREVLAETDIKPDHVLDTLGDIMSS